VHPPESEASTIEPPQRVFTHGRMPGNMGIWVGIFCIWVEFTLLFTVYFVSKAHNQEAFLTGPDRLLTLAGVSITLILLTSGYCMVKAIEAIRRDQHKIALRWIIATIVLGLGYPAIKYFEIRWNISNGVVGETGIFYTVYYYLTLNHLVHVCWALLGLLFVAVRTGTGAYSSNNYAGLEAAALFWHTTDVIWLALFPLFYVLR